MTKRSLSQISDEADSVCEDGSDYANDSDYGDESPRADGQGDENADVRNLREVVRKQKGEIDALKSEVKKLKTTARKSIGQPATTLELGSAAAAEQAEKLRETIVNTLARQMKYKKTLNASIMRAEFPCVPEPVVAALFGDWKPKSTSKTVKPAKRLQLDVPGLPLRFRGSMEMVSDSQTATWVRDGGMLKVMAKYKLEK